jgi:hypothetical protein
MTNHNITIGPRLKLVLLGSLAVLLILALVALGADDIVLRMLDLGAGLMPGND